MVLESFRAYPTQVHWGCCVLAIGLLLDHPQISNLTLKMFIPRLMCWSHIKQGYDQIIIYEWDSNFIL